MFAVVRTGGKQYRVAAGDKIAVEKLAGEAGDTIELGDVLLAGDGGDLAENGSVKVSAEIIAQAKSEKIVVFKKRRRHNYRRKNGHRQQMTLLRILSVGDDVAPTRKAEAGADPTADKPEPQEPANGVEVERDDAPKKAEPVKDGAGSKSADKAATE